MSCRRFAARPQQKVGVLGLFLLALCCVNSDATAAAWPPIQNNPYAPFVDEAAQRFGIPASWVRAVMQIESRGNPDAVSPKGAMGLMQIMPTTWTRLRAAYRLGSDAFDPHDNILAGTALLRELYTQFGLPGAFAAYNAGPVRLQEHLSGVRPLPSETVRYLALVERALPDVASSTTEVVLPITEDWRSASLFRTDPKTREALIEGSPIATPPAPPKPTSSFVLAPSSGDLFVALRAPTL